MMLIDWCIGFEYLKGALKDKHITTFQDWLRIDQVERQRGAILGKEREKVCTQKELLSISTLKV